MKKAMNGVILLTICTALPFLGGCQKKEEAKKMSNIVTVDTQIAQTGTLELSGEYIGTVAPGEEVNVMPLASGTVTSVKVKKGDYVKKGDVLCQFDDTAVQFSVDNAQIAVDSAKAGKQTAKDQAALSSLQTQGNITSLQSQLTAYEKSLKQAKSQRKGIQDSISKLKTGMDAAQKAVEGAKAMHKSAESLYLYYRVFLTTYPDCQTTAGLNAAAAEVVMPDNSPSTEAMVPTTPTVPAMPTVPEGSDSIDLGGETGGEIPEVPSSPTVPTTPVPDTSGINTDQALLQQSQKSLQAKELLKALKKAKLTVEYLNETGLNSLKSNVTEAQNAYNSTSAAYGEAKSGLSQLDGSISTLKTQIQGTRDGISSAKKAKNLSDQVTQDSVNAVDHQIDAAKVGLESAEYQADLYTVEAPMDGIIESVNVKKNEVFGTGMPAFTISDKESAQISFYVTEDVRNFLEMGDDAKIECNNQEFSGNVSEIATGVDPQKGLFLIKAVVDLNKGENLATGSSAKITLTTSRSASEDILIPYDSVYYEDNQAYVFTIQDDEATRTDVQTGLYNEDTIEVISGLTEGDEVVTSWASGLKNGAKIKRQKASGK